MRVQHGEIIPLGHGVWVRSDDVIAVEPVRENRGPGRRSQVWVRGLADPLIASRSEEAVVRDLTEPRTMVDRVRGLETAVKRVTDSIEHVPPVLLRVIAQETGLDLLEVASEAKESVGRPSPNGRQRPRRRAANQPRLLSQQ
jgi:hypothetical protein